MNSVVLLGFGRMGISHLSQLLGLIGKPNKLVIIDSSKKSRLLAKTLFPEAFVTNDLHKVSHSCFDYGLICTPPLDRNNHVSWANSHCKSVLVEKPLLVELPENCMSGYVYQHLPILSHLPNVLRLTDNNIVDIPKIRVSIRSNIDFGSLNNWRGKKVSGLKSEFFGHAATFAVRLIQVITGKEVRNCLCDSEYNGTNVHISTLYIDKFEVKIELNGSQNVKKTQLKGIIEHRDQSIEVSPYSIIDGFGNTLANIASESTSVKYYLRGFEFAEQTNRLISQQGDYISAELLQQIEMI